MGADGAVLDTLPMAGADFWSHPSSRGMRASAIDATIYDGSFERRLQATIIFINKSKANISSPNAPIAVNVSGHYTTSDSSNRITNSNLIAAWFEHWITDYTPKNPLSQKTPHQRHLDLKLAQTLSKRKLPIIAAYTFNVNPKRSLEIMLATYMTAKESDSLKLQPMPVNPNIQERLHDNNYFQFDDFSKLNPPAA